MDNNIKDEMQELENWLADPHEFGHKPFKIEYTNHFVDKDGISCTIFKFKKNLTGKWLLGIVSESGTFSEMGLYRRESEIEDAKQILDMLKSYWKSRAEYFNLQ